MEAAQVLIPDINAQLGEPDDNHPPDQSEQPLPPCQENPVVVKIADQPTGVDSVAVRGGDPEVLDPYIGMVFDSVEAAKKFYSEYALRLGFRARSAKTRTSERDGSQIMQRMVCYKEGFSLKRMDDLNNGRERKKRASIREGCKAMFEVVRRGQNQWIVSKLVTEHSHVFASIEALKPKPKKAVPIWPLVHTGVGEQKQLEPHVGMVFDSLMSAKQFYSEYAQCIGFRARSGKTRLSERDGSVIMQRFTCYKEGFPFKRVEKWNDGKVKRKRTSVREGCMAMLEVVRRGHDIWVISKLVTEHTHALMALTEELVSKLKKAAYSMPVDMRSLSEDSLMYPDNEITDYTIWREGDAFGLLEYLKMKQSKNPAFFYSIKVDEKKSVTNVFWTDARARMAYSYFGDAIALDTTYKKNRHMMPFVLFTGVNHHLHPVVLGCALLFDETESSFVWLFDTFLVAMCGHHPVSLVTEHSNLMGAAAAKVFPNTHHRFCKWHILSECKVKLPSVCSTPAIWCTFKRELKECIEESETVEDFESGWEAILDKYKLRENMWLQSLYEVRQQWAMVYLKNSFFAEVSPAQKSESMNKFFLRNFKRKTTLQDFISKFDQAIMAQLEKEVQADFANMYTAPVLKTLSPIEKQAAATYTKTIFALFQEEFIQSSDYSHSVDLVENGTIRKYLVSFKGDDAHKMYIVSFNSFKKSASCSCCKFEFSGILCRHVLRIFLALGIQKLPEGYFLKRWTPNAKNGAILYESEVGLENNFQNSLIRRCNDIFVDVFKYAAEGGTSSVIYKVAKDALQKAFMEVIAAKKTVLSIEPGK